MSDHPNNHNHNEPKERIGVYVCHCGIQYRWRSGC